MTKFERVIAKFDEANLRCASIIASDPLKYPEGSLAAMWADAVLTKAAQVDDSECGPLFRKPAA